jgi:hypothetical protein
VREASRFGIGLGVAATIACAALGSACELLFGLDGLTGGTCDADCVSHATVPDGDLGSGDDAWVAGGDDGDDTLGTESQDAGEEVSFEAGPFDAGLPDASLPDVGPFDAGLSDADAFDAGLPDASSYDAGSSSDGSPEVGPPEAGLPETGPSEAGMDAGGPCTCVPAPPVGWTGPVAIWEGSGPAPGCSGDYSAPVLDALADLDAGAARCTCDCGPLTGASCPSSFTATIFGDQGCTSACDSVDVSAGACVNVHGKCANVHGIGASPQAEGGSCTPRSSTVVPIAGWARAARACESVIAPVQSGCTSGQICAPAPAAPLEPRLCVFMAGQVACPGGYAVQRIVYGGVADSRGCTPCSCGASGVSCTGTLQEGCGQSGPVNDLPTVCGGLTDPGSVMLLAALVASGGSCASDGGVPTGSAAPSSPTTVCCLP